MKPRPGHIPLLNIFPLVYIIHHLSFSQDTSLSPRDLTVPVMVIPSPPLAIILTPDLLLVSSTLSLPHSLSSTVSVYYSLSHSLFPSLLFISLPPILSNTQSSQKLVGVSVLDCLKAVLQQSLGLTELKSKCLIFLCKTTWPQYHLIRALFGDQTH